MRHDKSKTLNRSCTGGRGLCTGCAALCGINQAAVSRGWTISGSGRDSARIRAGMGCYGAWHNRRRLGVRRVCRLLEAEVITCDRATCGGGIIYIIGTLIATVYLFGLVVPGPILGVISGAGILGLGIAKWLRGTRTAAVIAR
jgi:hypothetical protein